MELVIAKELQEKILAKSQAGDRYLLDFEDGDGPFANSALTCRLDLSFRFIIIPKDYPEADLKAYDETLTTQMGPVKIKKSSEVYLDPHTEFVVGTTGSYQLKGQSGVLADNIPILRIEEKLAQDK